MITKQEIISSVVDDVNIYFGDGISNRDKWRFAQHVINCDEDCFYSRIDFPSFYQNSYGNTLEAAMNLADIRCEIFDAFMDNEVGDMSLNELESTVSYVWFLKLRDRLYSQKSPDDVKHYWLN